MDSSLTHSHEVDMPRAVDRQRQSLWCATCGKRVKEPMSAEDTVKSCVVTSLFRYIASLRVQTKHPKDSTQKVLSWYTGCVGKVRYVNTGQVIRTRCDNRRCGKTSAGHIVKCSVQTQVRLAVCRQPAIGGNLGKQLMIKISLMMNAYYVLMWRHLAAYTAVLRTVPAGAKVAQCTVTSCLRL